tara:strand:+ start:296 stop:427 length:132 start_codon:yes stop_codon:yes gene_type:complete
LSRTYLPRKRKGKGKEKDYPLEKERRGKRNTSGAHILNIKNTN